MAMNEPHPLEGIKHVDDYTIDDLNADVLMLSRALVGYLRVVRGAKRAKKERHPVAAAANADTIE
jgi:hypothetical protein